MRILTKFSNHTEKSKYDVSKSQICVKYPTNVIIPRPVAIARITVRSLARTTNPLASKYPGTSKSKYVAADATIR